jgi:hypothetical protein
MSGEDHAKDENPDGWRIDNARRLAGLTLHFQRYTRRSESWDHDHCAACWAKLAEFDAPGVLHEGYATGADYAKGACYEWVCTACFTELAKALGWNGACDPCGR